MFALIERINKSSYKFTMESENEIRFGLAAVKNVGEAVIDTICKERDESGYLFPVPPVLHGPSETGRQRRTSRSLQEALRHVISMKHREALPSGALAVFCA